MNWASFHRSSRQSRHGGLTEGHQVSGVSMPRPACDGVFFPVGCFGVIRDARGDGCRQRSTPISMSKLIGIVI